MHTKRIIPCLDCDLSVPEGRVVKGVKFKQIRYAGNPVELARQYYEHGADEIIFLDITASHERRGTMVDVVERVAKEVFIPLTVGGGIRTVDDIRKILRAGADKVSINTSAIKSPDLIRKASDMFGSQCIVVAIDAKRREGFDDFDISNYNKYFGKGASRRISVEKEDTGVEILETYFGTPDTQVDRGSRFECSVYGGRKMTGVDAVKWARKIEQLGAGDIMLTSMDRDGTKVGFDLMLTRAISESVNIPVIASGGVGNLEHIYDAFAYGAADAALAASIFHFGQYSIGEVKSYLKEKGIEVRV